MQATMKGARLLLDAQNTNSVFVRAAQSIAYKIRATISTEAFEKELLALIFKPGNVVVHRGSGKTYRVEESDYVSARLTDVNGQCSFIEWFDGRTGAVRRGYVYRWMLAGPAMQKMFSAATALN